MDALEHDVQAQRMAALERFAGGVAHDFNNVLTVVLGYSEMLMRSLPDGDPSRPTIEEIAAAARRGTAITRQLTLFSGRPPARPRLVNVCEWMTAASSTLQRLIPEQVALDLIPPDRSLRVLCDPEELDQLLVSLTVQACEAMRAGGTLHIEACCRRVARVVDATVAEVTPEEYVLIRITDTGEGMDAATRERLFEPFFNTKQPGKGAGLRLAAAFGIVKSSGGFMTVQSAVGLGSTYEVYLPIPPCPQPFCS